MSESRAPGLRVQIVLALAGLLLLAFVPLFVAVASVTQATLRAGREQAARSIGRLAAAHAVVAARDARGASLDSALGADVGPGKADAVAIFAEGGALVAHAGEADVARTDLVAARTGRDTRGAFVDVVETRAPLVAVARVRLADEDARAAPLLRLVALYTLIFALALLTFAYFALTRLIVRPVDALVRAADRVAGGSTRALAVPRGGARELTDLGASLEAMTARLLRDEAALRSKVNELTETTRRLTEAQRQLARSEHMASVGRLAAGLAHEVGNPITALLGMEDLLLDGDLPEEAQRDFVRRMKKETERVHGVLRDLLEFARPEGAGTAPEAGVADVASVVDDVIALVRPQKSFKEVRLARDVPPGLRVPLAEKRLAQILLNLLLNAGAALAGVRDAVVRIRARREEGTIRIEIEDTGPGVAPAMRARIFEPFVTTKEVGEGTGLGLSVCRGLVEAVGGSIAVDPAYDAGARFVLLLPAARDDAA